MITHRILPLLFAAASQLASAQTITGTNPVKIFILAGESNMHGKGTVSPATTQGTLDYIVANDPTGKYQFLKSGGNYVTRADVGIRGLVYSGAPNPGNLTINYGGLATGLIGPELGFGHVLGDAYQNKILIVKVGVDGTTLGSSFCPPSSRVGDPEPVVAADKGFYYKEIIRLVNEAKTSLGATPHEVAGLGWHQGWNDRVNTAFSASYETNMANFINDIRTDLATPNMPVVIASAAMDEGLGYSEVEKAQLKMANPTAYPAFAGNVATVNTRINYEDLEFWQSAAKSPANEGYHWNRSGKTFLHIGMAMGDAISLMAPNRIPYRIRSSGGSNGTTLTWKNGTELPTSVRVLRNGSEIAAAAPVNPPTFVDATPPLGVSNYELQFTMPGAAAQPLTISHNSGITGLKASDRLNGIKLTWQSNLNYTGILVKRNGTTIAASLPGNTTQFVDNAPVAGATTYTVEPVDPGSTPASVQLTVSAAPRGTAVIYEPFDMTAAATLNDKPGGIGLDGNWVSGTDVQVTAGSFTFGTLPTYGNRIARTASNGTISISVGPSLSEAGLLDDGAQLWFSFLCPNPNNINVTPNLVFGNDSLSSTTSVSNSGNAIGVRINQGTTVQAITCLGGGIVATSTTQATLAASELALVVGKITWGSTPAAVDTIQIYTPGTNLALDTPQSATAVLDQSTFNVISSWGNGNTPNIDEIRFGATYADVIGQGIDTSGDLTAPTPATMSFATPPTAVLDSSITMTATTASDANGVQYRFHNTTRNTFSPWQDSPSFTDTGLAANTSYSYTVQARDKSVNQNPNTESPPLSATTLTPDTTAPPTPGFAAAPAPVSATAISMTATTVTDPQGAPVQYRFHNTTLGTNSGWQSGATYNFTGLIPSTSYSFTVQARDTASVPNETAQSAPLSATTLGPTNGTWAFDSDGTWSDSAKWTSNLIAVGSGATASFTSNITANRTISIDTPRTIGNITFNDASNDLIIAGANTLTLDVPTASPIIDVTAAGRTLTVSTVITGNDGLQKNGSGILSLAATNTYSGTTSVTNGILNLSNVSLSGFGGGSGRNITVSTAAAVLRNALDNTFLNRIVENTNEFTLMTGATSNNLDFSSSTGANLPNAFLGNYAGNGAKCEYSGTITPAADAYRIGGKGSNGLLGIVGANKLTGSRGLIVGGTGASGIRTNLAAAQNFTGDTVINTGARLSLGNNLALQNSALNVGSAGGNFSCAAGTNAGRISGETEAASPTFGGLIGSRNLLTVFSNGGGNNETNLASTAVTGFTLNPGTGITCTYSGTIADFAAGTTLTKTGDGTQELTGTNTYSGNTTVSGGTLRTGNASGLGFGGRQTTTTGITTVSSGFTLDLNGTATINEPLVLNGVGMGGIGALVNDNTTTAAVIGSGVAGIQLPATTTGSGYSAVPTVNISGAGSGAGATASLGLTTASFAVNVSGDRNYTVAPTIAISGGGGSGATATPILSGGTTGTVTGLAITSAGSGYTSAPTATVSGGTSTGTSTTTFTGNATNFTVAGLTMTAAGNGYAGTPAYTFSSGNAAPGGVTLSSVTLASDSSIGGAADIAINAAVNQSGGSRSLTKVGAGKLTLAGANTYTGATNVNQGTLALFGGSHTSPVTVASGASLGFTLGSPTTSTSSVNLINGTVKITGAVNNSSDYLLMTATTITGTPVLDSPIPGYQLQKASGNTQLKLVLAPYSTWATGGELFGDDANGDGVKNGLAFLLGAANPNANALGLLPKATENTGGLVLTFSILNAANRGTARASVQWSHNLGVTDLWSNNMATVPETTSVVNGVSFVVTPNGTLNNVVATIPAGEAAGGRLFGRLDASE